MVALTKNEAVNPAVSCRSDDGSGILAAFGGQDAGLYGASIASVGGHPGKAGTSSVGHLRRGGEQAGCAGGTLADEKHRGGIDALDGAESCFLLPRRCRNELRPELGVANGEVACHGDDLRAVLAVRVAKPQEEHASLVFRIEGDKDDLVRGSEIGEGYALVTGDA